MPICSHCAVNTCSSQNNYGACLSAACDNAEFLYSTFADFNMLQLISVSLVPNIIIMALLCICLAAKTFVVLVVCFSQRPELRWLPHMDEREPLSAGNICCRKRAYGLLLYIIYYCYHYYYFIFYILYRQRCPPIPHTLPDAELKWTKVQFFVYARNTRHLWEF
jgi:hypothetical protein